MLDGLYTRLRESRWGRSFENYRAQTDLRQFQDLVQQNPKQVYEFYREEQLHNQEPVTGVEGFFSEAKNLFLSFLRRLNPARRAAYLFSLGIFVWGFYRDEWGGAVLAFAVLSFLLSLELAEKLLTKDELEIARAIQFSLQPQDSPHLERLDISSFFQPAKDVGGDYYDYSVSSGDQFTVILGDVSGKGMPAALYAMKLQALFELLGKTHDGPKKMLTTMNDVLGARLAKSYFITAVVGVLNLEGDEMSLARAGHNHPLHYRASTGRVHWLKPEGLGIGMKAGPVFTELLEETRVSLHDGDVVVFYTDGITEAMNPDYQTFGTSRLASIVNEHAGESAARIKAAILAELEEHRSGSPLADDMTFVVAKIKTKAQLPPPLPLTH